MAKKWLLLAGLIWLAVPVCCEAVGQIGQAGLHGPSGLDVLVGSDGEGATVGEPAGIGLGIAEQARAGIGPQGTLGAAVGMPQRIRERWMNREAPAAETTVSDPPEQSETPDSDEGDPDVGTVDEEAPNGTHRPSLISNLLDTGLLTEDQVGAMRTAGAGWGAIRISGLLADRIAPDNEEGAFDTALQSVLSAREEGMGFGRIALTHDLKLGHLLANAK